MQSYTKIPLNISTLTVKSHLFLNFADIHVDHLYSLVFIYNKVLCVFSGWSEAVRFGRPALWWMSWRTVCWEIRTIFLRKRDVSAVLLWTVLGYHTFQTRPGISQATGQGRCGQAKNCPIQMVKKSTKYNPLSWKAFYCVSNCYGDYMIRNGVLKETRNFTFLIVINQDKRCIILSSCFISFPFIQLLRMP